MKRIGGIAALALALAAGLATAAPAQAECKLGVVAEMPLVMDGNRPLIKGAINGEPMLALADTGAFNSMLWRGAAERRGLDLKPVRGLQLSGVGGTHNAQSALVKELKLGDSTRRDVDLLVGGRGGSLGAEEIAMIIGQDVFTRADVEIDLANNMIRLVKATGCKDDSLAYWSQDYSLAKLKPIGSGGLDRHIEVEVLLNGAPAKAWMDTGAYTSVVTKQAARRAGVQPAELDGPDGRSTGIGGKSVDNWTATFDTFQIGDETIRKAHLRVAELFRHTRDSSTGTRLKTEGVEIDMLLGADFFRAHRVLIAYSQNKVYFTHNGGPVFQVRGPAMEQEPVEDEGSAE